MISEQSVTKKLDQYKSIHSNGFAVQLNLYEIS